MPTSTKLSTAAAAAATNDNNNNHLHHKNEHESFTCQHCHEVFGHKLELTLHIAALHNSGRLKIERTKNEINWIDLFLEVKLFANNHAENEIEDDEDEEEEEMEDEQIYEKDEDISDDTSEQNIDLLEDWIPFPFFLLSGPVVSFFLCFIVQLRNNIYIYNTSIIEIKQGWRFVQRSWMIIL